jgi:carbamoyltransferase
MGMAAYGNATAAVGMQKLVKDSDRIEFRDNLHTGIDSKYLQDLEEFDIAAGAQAIAEQLINSVMRRARDFKWSNNLVYMGGVALNCSANRNLGKFFDNIWIMPCPGDAGSSLGLLPWHGAKELHWTSAILGHDIPGDYPVAAIAGRFTLAAALWVLLVAVLSLALVR